MKPITRIVTQTACHECGKLVFCAKRNDVDGALFYMDDFMTKTEFVDGKIIFTEQNWGHKCEK